MIAIYIISDRKLALFQKNKTIKRSQFVECWAGIGLMVGIWAVTYGIIASGILIK